VSKKINTAPSRWTVLPGCSTTCDLAIFYSDFCSLTASRRLKDAANYHKGQPIKPWHQHPRIGRKGARISNSKADTIIDMSKAFDTTPAQPTTPRITYTPQPNGEERGIIQLDEELDALLYTRTRQALSPSPPPITSQLNSSAT
jgi:hypothetical protein